MGEANHLDLRLEKRVILSGVPARAKVGRNAVEGSRRFRATLPVVARDPSTALRPPFRLRSAQDDTHLGGFVAIPSRIPDCFLRSTKNTKGHERENPFRVLSCLSWTLLFGTVFLAASARAQVPDKVNYTDHVLPIFRNSCLNCHNPDKKKAGLDLSTFQGAILGSENGKVLKSGDGAGSLLIKCVGPDGDPKMPPKGDRLPDTEIAIIKKWIDGQLLETAGGKAIAAAANNVQVAVVSLTRPDGPPPMPHDLPLDPVVHTSKTNALTALGASPWAPLVALGGQKQILLYNTETLEPLGVLPFPEGFPTIIRFSRNGQLILTGGGRGGKSGKVVLWNVQTGERIATVGNEFDQVLAADISADQQFVALGGPAKLVKIYATKDGRLVHSIKKHTDWVTAISYSPDGRLVASADRNGGVIVWEADKGKEYNVLAGHKGAVTGLSFMTGVVASASEDATIKLWDVKEGKEIKSWSAHAGGVQSVDFTPDGRLVSSGRDKIARVWDQTGKQLMASEPFADIALRAEMAGERVVAGDWSGEVRVWSLDGKRVGELNPNPPTIAERLATATKQIVDAQTAVPELQKQIAAAEEKIKVEMAGNEEKRKAEMVAAEAKKVADIAAAEAKRKEALAAVEAAKVAPQQMEKRIADGNAALPALQAARDSAASVADAAAKILAFKQTSNAPPTELEEAKKEVAIRTAPRDAAQKLVDAKKAEIAQAEAAIAQARAEQPAKIAAAEKAVQDIAAQIAALQQAPVAAVVAPTDSPAAQEIAKAKTAIAQSSAQIAAAQGELDKWRGAQVLQNVHNARQMVADKQALYDGLVQAVKDAPLAIERARTDLAAAEKTAAEAPAKLKEKETLFAAAQQAAAVQKAALDAAQAAVVEKEKALKALTDAPKPASAPPNTDALAKKLADLNAENVKVRAERATKTAGTPEYAAVNVRVQGIKPEIAAAQAALDAAKGGAPAPGAPDLKPAQAELAKAKETLNAAKAEAKPAEVKLAAAEKALAALRKEVEAAAQLAAQLRKDLPTIEKTALAAKAQAEQGAQTAAREVEAAKVEAEKRRAAYETLKAGTPKSAALTPAPHL